MKSKAILLAAALVIVIPFGVASAKDNDTDVKSEIESGRSKLVAETETETSGGEMPEAVKQRVEQAKESAKAKVEEAKAAAKERKIALKQDRCEARKTTLIEKLPQLSHSVTTIQGVLDAKYEKVKAIYESHKLSVSNYDELNADIIAKQAAAEEAISSADLTTLSIDCNDNNLGVQLDGFRSSVNAAKAALKDYRTALVNLISALNASADKIESDQAQAPTTNTTNNTAEGAN